jgi:hypothetical protein
MDPLMDEEAWGMYGGQCVACDLWEINPMWRTRERHSRHLEMNGK